MKIIASLAAAVLLTVSATAQELPPLGETRLNGHGSEYLGVIDGCRVHVIKYWGTNVFVARCPEGAGTTNHTQSCGENCTENVQTTGTRQE